MGCGASKEVESAVLLTPDNRKNPTDVTNVNGGSSRSESPAPSSRRVVDKNHHSDGSISKTRTAKDRQHEWAVRPGYSSGASSYAGSDVDIMEGQEMELTDRSCHLALSSLRKDIVAEGDLTKTVVRIETPFGKPIEEIYSGVHDGPVLGSGVAGIVRLVTHIATQIKYAVKCLDIGLIDSTEGLRQLRDEVFIMCQLDHPNIVRIEEVYEGKDEIYIVQELCIGGDLFDRLDEQTDYHYTEAQCARLVKQMLSSVRYLHSKGIVHRDLKLENFLFSSTKSDSDLKMIDFGLSKHFELGESHHEKVGTPYTVAPEIILGSYDEKCDLWSIGVISYLLLSGETPFGGLDGENLLLVKENIMRARVVFKPPDVWESVSEEGKAFVKRLLVPDPKQRPTAKKAQKDPWIQVWAKKDATSGANLNPKTLQSLMAFKESSDMQKLLSEVLSFTLLPEQIVDLRREFEKIDTDGSGEISLKAMKRVLMQNAEAGSLGALTEQEIEDIFDAIRIRKNEPTIRWHEFLAAGLSQARVDDRNLRLAFDRLDVDRVGYITFDNLQDLLGTAAESDVLERLWMESLKEIKNHMDRITFDDFKALMKGQSKDNAMQSCSSLRREGSVGSEIAASKPISLLAVPEGEGMALASVTDSSRLEIEESLARPKIVTRMRSQSFQAGSSVWERDQQSAGYTDKLSDHASRDASRAVSLHKRSEDDERVARQSILTNRNLYRKHRELRLTVLEASKQFDVKRSDWNAQSHVRAGLVMKRGVKPPVDLEDAHTRTLFDDAAKRCGRAQRTRNKTVSDVTGMMMMMKSQA